MVCILYADDTICPISVATNGMFTNIHTFLVCSWYMTDFQLLTELTYKDDPTT